MKTPLLSLWSLLLPDILHRLLPRCTLLITSESSGIYSADDNQKKHIHLTLLVIKAFINLSEVSTFLDNFISIASCPVSNHKFFLFTKTYYLPGCVNSKPGNTYKNTQVAVHSRLT